MAAREQELVFTSEIKVALVQSVGGDLEIVRAARASTRGRGNVDPEKESPEAQSGLISYLIRHHHSCYDDKTEVLTDSGWKKWPEVTGRELFLTLSPDEKIEYQPALAASVSHFEGDMIRVETEHADLLVTPNHRVLASRRCHSGKISWNLVPVTDLFEASHRMRLGGGCWVGEEKSIALARLLGFFIGDGNCHGSVTFNIRRERKIAYLKHLAGELGWRLSRQSSGVFYLACPATAKELFASCYRDGHKQIPQPWLMCGEETLRALLDGLINSDGSVASNGKTTFSTTSPYLADQFQELALKVGQAATVRLSKDHGVNNWGGPSKPLYSLCLFKERNSFPRVGWTTSLRSEEVRKEPYRGGVYCVTVANGTLYVRRNGKPLWCGNSPFEHGLLTFAVHAPAFVWWQIVRHRFMALDCPDLSPNLESARYRELEPVFWVPRRDRPLVKAVDHKSARPKFDPCPEKDWFSFRLILELAHKTAWSTYRTLIEANVASEVARAALPFAIYYHGWVSCNPLALMNFLAKRTRKPNAEIVSYVQAEIEEAASVCEELFKQGWPITWKCWDANGRVAP